MLYWYIFKLKISYFSVSSPHPTLTCPPPYNIFLVPFHSSTKSLTSSVHSSTTYQTCRYGNVWNHVLLDAIVGQSAMPVEAATDKSDGVRRAFYSLILSSHWRRCWRLTMWRQNLSCHSSFFQVMCIDTHEFFFLFGTKQILLSIKPYLFLNSESTIWRSNFEPE